jgi:hypothetical protein
MLDDEKVLKRYRVITKNRRQKINGLKPGEIFEAEWPDPWLERRLAAHQIEEVPMPEPTKIAYSTLEEWIDKAEDETLEEEA